MKRFEMSYLRIMTHIRPYICAALFVLLTGGTSCDKIDHPWKKPVENYAPDVAVAWMNMNMRLTKGTAGFNSIVSSRSFAYSGLSLYESIAPGIPGHQSIASQLNGSLVLPGKENGKDYYWPASANAALASISRSLFANTTSELLAAIDSLEESFTDRFKHKAETDELERSIDFGYAVSKAIFDWSKDDGGHEAYKHLTSDSYTPPMGPGLWVPTPPAFSKPFHNGWGANRSFVPRLAGSTSIMLPPGYSESTESDFYKAANEIYQKSQQLSSGDSTMAKFWADLPSNYNVPSHAVSILTQLILSKKFTLAEAAILYCKHGIAGNEALIACFKEKYKCNLVRPVTYIREVLGFSDWNPLVPTPPFPEYPSAHAVISAAFATVLERHFGKNYAFTDHTYDHLYGPRHFSSFDEYVQEAAESRIYGGIHYAFAASEGIKQGKKIGEEVNEIKFKKGSTDFN